MDPKSELAAKINTLCNELLVTPAEATALAELKRSIQARWEEYKTVVTTLRETTPSRQLSKELDTEFAQLTGQVEATISDIGRRQNQLKTPTPAVEPKEGPSGAEAIPVPDPLNPKMDIKPIAATAGMANPKLAPGLVALAEQAAKSPDAALLLGLLHKISDQYTEILAGGYPKPLPGGPAAATTSAKAETEPMVGSIATGPTKPSDPHKVEAAKKRPEELLGQIHTAHVRWRPNYLDRLPGPIYRLGRHQSKIHCNHQVHPATQPSQRVCLGCYHRIQAIGGEL